MENVVIYKRKIDIYINLFICWMRYAQITVASYVGYIFGLIELYL